MCPALQTQVTMYVDHCFIADNAVKKAYLDFTFSAVQRAILKNRFTLLDFTTIFSRYCLRKTIDGGLYLSAKISLKTSIRTALARRTTRKTVKYIMVYSRWSESRQSGSFSNADYRNKWFEELVTKKTFKPFQRFSRSIRAAQLVGVFRSTGGSARAFPQSCFVSLVSSFDNNYDIARSDVWMYHISTIIWCLFRRFRSYTSCILYIYTGCPTGIYTEP